MTPPSGSIYLGVYVNPSNVPSPPSTLIDGFQQQIGRNLALSPHYYGFYDTFPGTAELDDIANGRIPFISWNCQPTDAAIAAGDDDKAIRRAADTIAAFGYPIFLRYFWEMNLPAGSGFRSECYDPNTDLANGYFSPQYYILAWKRIRAIFAQEGVRNVVWVWNPSGTNNPAPYYPGASEADWVAFDFYDRKNVSPSQTYAQPYSWLSLMNKPILIGESGATLPVQPSFFGALASTLQTQFPQVQAYVYFDGINSQFGGEYTWSIDSTTIGNFAAFANTPYVTAMPTISPVP
jgi:hypothetical protein